LSIKVVVIADDTEFVRDRFASALTEAGLRPVGVGTTAELLARLGPGLPAVDLLVLDLQLPPGRGVSLVRAIRGRDGGADLRILVFSGTIADAGEVRALAELGVAGYVNEYSAPSHIVPSLAPHLFPDKFDRRAGPRVGVALSISYRAARQIASAVTLTLGKGGLSIRTMTPLEVGAVVRVRFRLPGDLRDLEADARVCWASRHMGMGLQFERLSVADQAAIDEFVDAHFFSNRRA
jgi:uncharacterized protein (TIGR02266 family)